MLTIIYTSLLEFEGKSLPICLASDRQVYVQLDELCEYIGLSPDGRIEQVRRDLSIADLLVYMAPQGQEKPDGSGKHLAYLNLAALPYWLGMIRSDSMERPELHDCLVRYALEFLDITWMLYRANADDLRSLEFREPELGAANRRMGLTTRPPSR